MLASDPLNPDTLLDFPHTRELREGVAQLRFAPELEGDYIRQHLQRVRLRVRVWFTVMALLGAGNVLLQALGLRVRAAPWAYDIEAACSIALACLAWSPRYLQWYLPAARVLVPLLGASTAVFVALAIQGHRNEQVAMLTTHLFVVYFLCGLLFRAALAASALTIVAFIAAAMAVALPVHELGPALGMLLLTGTIGAIVYRDIERSYRRGYLERALIGDLVTRDELSGLTNRRAFYEHLLRQWQHAQREGRNLAVWMVDIDRFKSYNDTFGHQAGDAALRAVGQLLKSYARRPLDLAARYGGDEFIAVLYDLPAEHLRELAERLRRSVQDYHLHQQTLNELAVITGGGARTLHGTGAVTVSIGIAVVVPTADRSLQGVVQLADEALYAAKQAGRNRVVLKDAFDHEHLDTGSFRQSLHS